MTREEKQLFVKEWSEELKDVPYAILVDYRGLTVAEATDLRVKMRESGCDYRVVKNTLAKLAVPGTQLENLAEHFVGPIALATHKEDPVGMAKALVDFSKESKKLELKYGVVDGQLIDSKEITDLSKMASRDELLGKLLYVIKYPIQGFASALNNIVSNLAVVLGQVAKGKE